MGIRDSQRESTAMIDLLPVDTTRLGDFRGISVKPHVDFDTGEQKTEYGTGVPLWNVECLYRPLPDEQGKESNATVETVSVAAAQAPTVQEMATIRFTEMTGRFYQMPKKNGGTTAGMTYAAKGIEQVPQRKQTGGDQ